MATYTGTFNIYGHVADAEGNGAINWDTDTFEMLLAQAAYVPAQSHSAIAQITNEASGGGYARKTLANVNWTLVATNVAMMDADDVVFTAAGGDFTAYYWVIMDTTATSAVCFYGLLDNTPGTVVVTDGNTLTVAPSASGLFRKTV